MSIYNQGFGGGMNPSITVTTTAGATVTVTLGTKSATAIATGGTAKISVWDYGSYSVHAVLGDAVGDATVDVIAVQDYAVTVETAVPIPAVLNNATWAQIKEVAEKSQGPNYWSVGDTKQIAINGKVSDGLTLSNYQTWVYIIGFDHNSSIEGTGIAFQGFKTAQSNGTDICLCDSGYNSAKNSGQWFNMNNNNNNSGGWNGCNMRNNTLPVVKSALPAELTSVIKTTSIYTDNTGGSNTSASYVTATQDELYLLAEFEIFGTRSYANTAEQNYQKQYAYYVAGNSKVKYNHDSTATTAVWWERSVVGSNQTFFCDVYTNGVAYYAEAYVLTGLAPAFKVGSNPPPQPISALSVGSSVYCNVSDVKTEFIVVNQGKPSDMYDDSCNGIWLLMKDIYEKRVWDSESINKYEGSDINTYLNSTFLNLFDSNIKDVIKQVKIPYRKNGGAGGTDQSGANGLSAKIFLLSGYEVGWTTSDTQYFPQDGAKLSYFASGTGTSANNKRIAKLNGSADIWWLRSQNTDDTGNVWHVSSDGDYVSSLTSYSLGIRPAFILPSDTLVDIGGNIVT